MATSVDDLLQEAQSHVWVAAQSLPPRTAHGPSRREVASERFAGFNAAWPSLAQSADYAFSSFRLQLRWRSEFDPFLVPLRRVAAMSVDGVPDPNFRRAASLLRAAGDAVQILSPRHDPADRRPADRILRVVDSAARLTAVYGEAAARSPRQQHAIVHDWHFLADRARHFLNGQSPALAVSPATQQAIPSPSDSSLAGVLDRWHREAATFLRERPLGPSLQMIPVALHQLHNLPGEHHAEAALRWREVAQAWTPAIRLPGRGDAPLHAATRELGDTLRRHGSNEDLALYVTHRAPAIGRAFAAQIERVVQHSLLVIPARRLAHELRPVPPELLRTAQLGGWVPIPPEAPSVQSLLRAAQRASGIYDRAIDGVNPFLLDAEAAAARRASAAGFSQSTRRMLTDTNTQASTGPAANTDQALHPKVKRDRT